MSYIIFILVISITVACFKNKYAVAISAAREVLRKKAAALPSNSIINFFSEHGIYQDLDCAIQLISILAEILDVDSEKLAKNYLISDLLTMRIDISNNGNVELLSPFSEEFLEKLILITDDIAWYKKLAQEDKLPTNDDELTDFILAMNIAEFIHFFMPMVKLPYSKK